MTVWLIEYSNKPPLDTTPITKRVEAQDLDDAIAMFRIEHGQHPWINAIVRADD